MAPQRCPPDILSSAAEAIAAYMNAAELSVSASHEKLMSALGIRATFL